MSRNVARIIEAVREHTDNQDYSSDATGKMTSGLSDNLILEYLNDAQNYLQSKIFNLSPSYFFAVKEIDIVAGQDAYTIQDNVFLGDRIINLEYSPDYQSRNYYELELSSVRRRHSGDTGCPDRYIRVGGQVILAPIPNSSSGRIRVTYYRALSLLDIRRGKISAKSSTTITLENDSNLDSISLAKADYVCTIGSLGEEKDLALVVSDYNSSTRVITIPSTTLTAAVGDYVVIGKYATTHSRLNEACERFLKVYAQLRLFNRDSSEDAVSESYELKKIERDILDSYEKGTDDLIFFPVVDEFLMR